MQVKQIEKLKLHNFYVKITPLNCLNNALNVIVSIFLICLTYSHSP